MTIKLFLLNGEELLLSILKDISVIDLPKVMTELTQHTEPFSTYAVRMLGTWYVFNPETNQYYKEA